MEMGSEKDGKHDKHSRDRDSYESKRKRRRRVDDSDDSRKREKDDGHRKKHKKSRRHHKERSNHDDEGSVHRSKKSKKQKRDHSRRKEERSSKRSVHKSMLTSMGETRGTQPSNLIDPEKDFYQYHQHLWVYLFREEGVAFSDLSSSDLARKAFARFCKKYNTGKLEDGYYKATLSTAVVDECQTTTHSWSFRTSEHEKESLHLLQDGIRKQTEYSQDETTNKKTQPASHRNIDLEEESPPAPRDHKAEKAANKRLREKIRIAEEEFSGGLKEGRERQIEKRKELAAKIHGASRDRDGIAELSDKDLYSDDRSSFNRALQREKMKSQKRHEKQQSRLEELQAKEKARRDRMFEQLGIDPSKL